MADASEATSQSTPERSSTPTSPRSPTSPSTRSPPSNNKFPLIFGVGSLFVALCAIAVVLIMDSNHLSTSRSSYYLSTLSANPRPRALRLGSFNIRYSPTGPLQPFKSLLGRATKPKSDELKRWGEAKWEERREKLVDQVLFHELDVVGFQEVLHHQLVDLEALMGEEFEFVGVGRNDGKTAGEAVPIFYRKSRFSLSAVHHFWLSPTPEVPGSKGWDADQTRMITVARLIDLQSRGGDGGQEEMIVANTHWDHKGLEARTQSAKLIIELLRKEAQNVTREDNGKEPLVVLLGDLNSPAEESGYQVLTGGKYLETKAVAGEKSKTFFDSRHELATRKSNLGGPGALSRAYGPLNTFTGFVPSDEPKIIDFILPYDNSAFSSPHSFGIAQKDEVDTTFLDADDPDEVLASIPEPSPLPETGSVPSSTSTESLFSASSKAEQQTKWKVSRYGVVPNFYEDIGGKRGSPDDGLIVSDHRLVVVAFEEIVA